MSMIEVSVRLLGANSRVGPGEEIAAVRIVNDGQGSSKYGSYWASSCDGEGGREFVQEVEHTRRDGSLVLLRKVLEELESRGEQI